jgi:hypothetical protein
LPCRGTACRMDAAWVWLRTHPLVADSTGCMVYPPLWHIY